MKLYSLEGVSTPRFWIPEPRGKSESEGVSTPQGEKINAGFPRVCNFIASKYMPKATILGSLGPTVRVHLFVDAWDAVHKVKVN